MLRVKQQSTTGNNDQRMDLAYKHCLVVGLGVTGIATARFLKHQGAIVTLTDIAPERDLTTHIPAAVELGVNLELGAHRVETFCRSDLIVMSPGVPHTIPTVQAAKVKGIAVMGEIELAYRFIREPIIAVTGTNGKTTATTLLGEMLKRSGYSVFVGGNIGTPLIDYAESGQKSDKVVVEISSFQLDTIETFRPRIGVLLNITEDHLDRYPSFTGYVQSKGRIFENQKKDDTAVFNGTDPNIRSICDGIESRKLPFYGQEKNGKKRKTGAVIESDEICFFLEKNRKETLKTSDIALPGKHNLENAAAAALAAWAAGGTLSGIRDALRHFKGLSHRIQHVDVVNGVRYINDSKATNVDATARALECFDGPVILIMGGRNKGGNFRLLFDRIHGKVKTIVTMGEAEDEIQEALKGAAAMESAVSIEDAVSRAHRAAAAGDVVLLSPACASFDMFTSYAERGEIFCRTVKKLKINKR